MQKLLVALSAVLLLSTGAFVGCGEGGGLNDLDGGAGQTAGEDGNGSGGSSTGGRRSGGSGGTTVGSGGSGGSIVPAQDAGVLDAAIQIRDAAIAVVDAAQAVPDTSTSVPDANVVPEPDAAEPEPDAMVGKAMCGRVYCDCTATSAKGGDKPLFGKVKEVGFNADFKVKVVDFSADLKVKKVNNLPNSCGKWQTEPNLPNFTIQVVEFGEDFTIDYVDLFEGLP